MLTGARQLHSKPRILREAYELCRQSWFSDDLSGLTSMGVPLWRPGSKMKARTASAAERASYRAAAEAVPQSDELFLFFSRQFGYTMKQLQSLIKNKHIIAGDDMTGLVGAVQAVFDKEKKFSGAGFVLYDDKGDARATPVPLSVSRTAKQPTSA